MLRSCWGAASPGRSPAPGSPREAGQVWSAFPQHGGLQAEPGGHPQPRAQLRACPPSQEQFQVIAEQGDPHVPRAPLLPALAVLRPWTCQEERSKLAGDQQTRSERCWGTGPQAGTAGTQRRGRGQGRQDPKGGIRWTRWCQGDPGTPLPRQISFLMSSSPGLRRIALAAPPRGPEATRSRTGTPTLDDN